jgi:dipeptidyl aminopeptidase/acylaminoacyl peptidase
VAMTSQPSPVVPTVTMIAAGRTLSDPQLSPDGEVVAFLADGLVSLVPAVGGAERVLTVDPRAVRGHALGGGVLSWMPNGSGVVFAGADGDIWWVPVSGGPALPVALGMGDAWQPAVAPTGEAVAFVRDDRAVCVAPLDGDGGEVRVVDDGADFVRDVAWSPDGTHLAWQAWDVPHMPWDESRLMVAAVADAQVRTLVHQPMTQVQSPQWSPDGTTIAYLSDAGGWLNLWLVDVATGERRHLVDEPHEHGRAGWGPGARTLAWSPDGDRIALCRNEDGFGRLCTVDVASGVVTAVDRGVHVGLSWRGTRLAAIRTGGRTPNQIVVHDIDGAPRTRTTVAYGPVAGFAGIEPMVASATTPDGHAVPMRRYGDGDRLLVMVHGGPTDQWDVTFRPRIERFVAFGWTVLVPDHRGSTGHGRAYAQAMRGGWGTVDVADTIAVIEHAIAQGWVDRGRIALTGGSAGGYNALGAAIARPDLVAACAVVYPVSDPVALMATTWRFEAHYSASIGGVPLHPEALTVPTLILHGDADKVVPVDQSRTFVEAAPPGMASLTEFEGEGHGWKRADTTAAELLAVERFLDAHVPPRPGFASSS